MVCKLEALVRKIRRHGVLATVYGTAVKALCAVVDLKILRGVFVGCPNPDFVCGPYAARLLDETQLQQFARCPANEMSQDFIDEATSRGDQCFAILDGARLAAYGWYAFSETPIGLPGVVLRYREGYVYMYKGFTHEDYRGKRLHAIGMTRALQHYLSRGYKGIVSYVESTNFDSLKSCFRMGYTIFGTVYVVKLLGRWRGFPTAGCRKYAFRVESALKPLETKRESRSAAY